ncbi:MalY/PatB family protein [Klebsiella variicola]
MYNFDEIIDRRSTNSMKWGEAYKRLTPDQVAADPLPMWVADMDFRVAPAISNAMKEEIDHGVLGYGGTPDSYLNAVQQWQYKRFGWRTEAEWIVRTPGIVSAINMAIQAFTKPGDEVIIMTPVYFHFIYDVINNGRTVIQYELNLRHDEYFFDAYEFEKKITAKTKMFILSNPHNPTGNVWRRDELQLMAEICAKNNIIVLSDEVHQDFIFSGDNPHIPFASLSEEASQISLICTAPSKTFNIAGLQCANTFIPNKKLREEFFRQCDRCGITLINLMGTRACEIAYSHCEDWADQMLDYIRINQLNFRQAVEKSSMRIKVLPTDSLYLAWIDFREYGMNDYELNDYLLKEARLWLDPGTKFGYGGAGFMRINLGCPKSIVSEAFQRLASAFN